MSNVSSKTKLLTARIPNSLHNRLTEAAADSGISVTACVIQAIKEYLERRYR